MSTRVFTEEQLANRRAVQKLYYEANKARLIKESMAWQRANRARCKVYRRRHALKRDYSISVLDYEALLAAGCGVCHLCGNVPSAERRLAVDHDHKTGAIRGLLCMECNIGLGKFKDSGELLRKAAAYIERKR